MPPSALRTYAHAPAADRGRMRCARCDLKIECEEHPEEFVAAQWDADVAGKVRQVEALDRCRSVETDVEERSVVGDRQLVVKRVVDLGRFLVSDLNR